MNTASISNICKALSDCNRVQILTTLSQGEMCACKLLEHFDITQPTLSHHMKILVDAGLVRTRKEGKWSHYAVEPSGFKQLEQFIGLLGDGKGETACLCD